MNSTSPICRRVIAMLLFAAAPSVAFSQFETLWILGIDDESQAEFSQEGGSENDPPGNPASKDDDYYFAGTYAGVGAVAADEEWVNFERAMKSSDPRVRLHFNLTEFEARSTTEFNLAVDFIALGSSGGISLHDILISFNDTEVFSKDEIDFDEFVDEKFSAVGVGAVEGENTITIERVGGSPSSWIQFDYIELLADTSSAVCSEPICEFTSSSPAIAPGEKVTVSWVTDPAATAVELVPVGDVGGMTDNGIGSVELEPAENTTYTLRVTVGGNVTEQALEVQVGLLNEFLALGPFPGAAPIVRPEQPVTLTWDVDPNPAVTVSIDNGVGDVTGNTTDGMGSVEVMPAADTTFTLTATRGADVATAAADVTVSSYKLLWQVGIDDGSQGEFSQEDKFSNERPGDNFFLDDDYYFPGDYTSLDPFIGVVDEVEETIQFERAVVSSDPDNRIHFVLSQAEAEADIQIRFTMDLIAGGWWDGDAGGPGVGFGTHDVVVSFNGNQVTALSDIVENTLVTETFASDTLGFVEGPNEVEITRTGGDSAGDGGNAGWISFDHISLEALVGEVVESPLVITGVSYDDIVGDLTVTWASAAGKSYDVDTSPDAAAWTVSAADVPSDGDSTDATVAVPAGTKTIFVRVREL